MSAIPKNHVNYYPIDGYFVVGDNKTSVADGITDTSYSDEITIEDKINGKEVLGVSQYAFISCLITKVTIKARLRIISKYAFCYCTKLEYINIPSEVTFIGFAAIFFGLAYTTFSGNATIEFLSGRTHNLYIDQQNFARKNTIYVIYPCNYVPACNANSAFYDATPYICAPSTFSFYTKQTINDTSKCPSPLFKGRAAKNICTCKTNRRSKNSILYSFCVCLFSPKR